MRAGWIRWFVDDVHYLHYGAFIFLVTLALTYAISLLYPPIPKEKVRSGHIGH
jgi:hypothetical protein